jgi:hypothetical protein
MHDIDRTMWQRKVMHRAEVAKLASRATLKRRIDAGFWWRPTYRTVAPQGVAEDRGFALLTALAHGWPNAALTGPAMLYVLGRATNFPSTIDISVPISRRTTHDGHLRLHAFERRTLREGYADGVKVLVDIGPSSIVSTALKVEPETALWLLIDAIGSAESRSQTRLLEAGLPMLELLSRCRQRGQGLLHAAVAAAIDGCQSPGEIEAWRLLSQTGLEFSTQKRWFVPLADRPFVKSASIYSDFWLPALNAVIEIDSHLHDHVRDVRRDTWLRRRGVRTVRFVGSDFFTAPEVAVRDLMSAIDDLAVLAGLRRRAA